MNELTKTEMTETEAKEKLLVEFDLSLAHFCDAPHLDCQEFGCPHPDLEWALYRDAIGLDEFDAEQFEDAFLGAYESVRDFIDEFYEPIFDSLPDSFNQGWIDYDQIQFDMECEGIIHFERVNGMVYVYDLSV